MKTNKIIAVAAVLALLAGSCTKDNLRIRLLSEPMSFGAKVLVDPTNRTTINNAQWVEGEQIYLGKAYDILNVSGSYYIDLDNPIENNQTAVYPATVYPATGNGNVVTLAGNTLTIHNLNIDFVDGGHKIILPMAATATAGSEALKFDHLTGGLWMTLTSASEDYTIGSLRIVTFGDGATADPIEPRHGITTTWAVQGLTVPGGEIGAGGDQVDAKYATQMDFTLSTNGTPGKALDGGSSIKFCVPITVSSVKKIQVTAFAPDGTQLLSKMKTYAEALDNVQANHMYLIDEIEF